MIKHNKQGLFKDYSGEKLDFENEIKELTNIVLATQGHHVNFISNLNLNTNYNSTFNHVLYDWEQHRRMCIVQLVCYLVHAMYLFEEMSTLVERPLSFSNVERENIRKENIHETIRRNKQVS